MYLLFFPFINQRQKDNSFLWCKTIMCEKWRALMEKSGNEFQPSHVVCLSGHSRGMSLHSYSQGGRLMFFGTNVPLSDPLFPFLPLLSIRPPDHRHHFTSPHSTAAPNSTSVLLTNHRPVTIAAS